MVLKRFLSTKYSVITVGVKGKLKEYFKRLEINLLGSEHEKNMLNFGHSDPLALMNNYCSQLDVDRAYEVFTKMRKELDKKLRRGEKDLSAANGLAKVVNHLMDHLEEENKKLEKDDVGMIKEMLVYAHELSGPGGSFLDNIEKRFYDFLEK